ncbi:ubiquitin conjugating enzyme E2 [Acrasis kona]|uniref:Ubiquitin conjugating enzyme E2 n=1 Tax=Acrasis kona TaxID=1008807 RepID=A0AAW2YGX9_9EUKA
MPTISKQCLDRLRKEYMQIKRNPVANIECAPLEDNILEWRYVIYGLPESEPYHNGFYHGKLLFSPDYPFKPPGIMMITPNGRFQTNTRLCLSMSDFHPESWNPLWSVQTILTGLVSFMLDNQSTYGSTTSTPQQKKNFARESIEFNRKDKTFQSLFKESLSEKMQKSQEAWAQSQPIPTSTTATPQTTAAAAAANTTVQKSIQFALFVAVISFIIYVVY